jgi:hypothetical protein
MEILGDALLVQPGARLLHRVTILDAVDRDRHVSLEKCRAVSESG